MAGQEFRRKKFSLQQQPIRTPGHHLPAPFRAPATSGMNPIGTPKQQDSCEKDQLKIKRSARRTKNTNPPSADKPAFGGQTRLRRRRRGLEDDAPHAVAATAFVASLLFLAFDLEAGFFENLGFLEIVFDSINIALPAEAAQHFLDGFFADFLDFCHVLLSRHSRYSKRAGHVKGKSLCVKLDASCRELTFNAE